MKNNIYLFLLLTSQLFFAQTGFETGNDFYKKEQYQKALASYLNVVGAHKESPELYFNIANSYYKLNKVAPAIYYYEKALVLDPKNKEVQNNLRFAQKRTIDEIKVVPQVGFEKLLSDFTNKYTPDTWAWIAIGFSVLFLLSFIGYYFSTVSTVKRIFFFTLFFAMALLAIALTTASFEKSQIENDKPAIVFADQTDMKEEAKNNSKAVVALREGTKVYVLENEAGWKKVQLTDGTEGWIKASAIREVK